MQLFTIGYTRKTAEQFFGLLGGAGVTRVIDTRLHNSSQLAGFTKKADLRFFLQSVGGIDYQHLPVLAPEKALLDAYRGGGGWEQYRQGFLDLMAARSIEQQLNRDEFANACLLCSEALPQHCHRRLVAEYLQQHWGDITIVHL